MRLKVLQALRSENAQKDIVIKGWIRTRRDSKGFSFLEINDGSCLKNIQAILSWDVISKDSLSKFTTGAAVSVKGDLVESPGKGQKWEIQVNEIKLLGEAPADKYPLQKKRHSDEFLRTIAHLRPRTNKYGAINRVRSALAFGIHKFFNERGFFYVHSPILTGSDCEGAGEMFTVTALDLQKINKQIDFTQDFFGKKAHLTVSGQLEAEILACALGDVYTFGPTFRAENSNTPRHAAEFWMLEPEMAFADLEDDMDLAEDLVKWLVEYIMNSCEDDIGLFAKFLDKELKNRLDLVLNSSFERVSYGEAIHILQKSKRSFEFPVKYGLDLQTEHERYLTEDYFKKPVFVFDYPKEIKAFYMRLNEDQKTVAAMDLLVPKVGELVGGSQREERLDVLETRMDEVGLDKEEYWWYLDLRRFGSVPHAGFGLGFERLIMFVTGVSNIRDVIPFPRTPKSLEF
ncbi:asparaginyl-tRNA synthetase [Desulfonauticus submarinus]|uniref:Asparagine--tRNA ligase n=1 Tax=Desulfonauticus submarinus TaxID=206665 RepID=A0A1H0EID7_9BACT|nr:asparagine--tRNA ligase [Desulfonauticus submarinus]SDN82112.1 asparaginyl-tRNA synthetase [Desulfonauticus submarinus]